MKNLEKCKEIYIHRVNALDAVAYIQMVALHQGYPLTHDAATKLVHYRLVLFIMTSYS